jgi:hypothetical protein
MQQPQMADINPYFTRFSAGGTALRDGRSVSRKRLALIGAKVPRVDLEARTILMHANATAEVIDIACEHETFTLDTFKQMAAPLKNDKGSAGKFRKGQGWIGGTSPADAFYVCPPVEVVEDLMLGLCDFINRDDIPATLQAAVAHVQMSIIHPFSDGNGRTARALVEVILRRRGVVSFISPPVFLYRLTLEDNDYVTAIKAFEMDSHQMLYEFWHDANGWGVEKIQQLQVLQQQFITDSHKLLSRGDVEATADIKRLLDLLFKQPVVTKNQLAEHFAITEGEALLLLTALSQCGIVKAHKLREPKDSVIWDAAQVFKLLDGFDQGLFGR